MPGSRDRRYQEGDVFVVPLLQSGFAPGVIARADGRGVLLAYFFGRRFERVPTISDVGELSALDHVLVKRCGDLGLVRGDWPIIGALAEWRREQWPIPAFVRHDLLTDEYMRVEYPDDDPNGQPREVPISREQFEGLPEDGMAGSQFVEARLSRLVP